MMDELSKLAQIYKTDKGIGRHGYTPVYNEYFTKYSSTYL